MTTEIKGPRGWGPVFQAVRGPAGSRQPAGGCLKARGPVFGVKSGVQTTRQGPEFRNTRPRAARYVTGGLPTYRPERFHGVPTHDKPLPSFLAQTEISNQRGFL